MTNNISFIKLSQFLQSEKAHENISQEEANSINSIWTECDTQDNEGNSIKKGDGNLNQTEFARFLNKLIETSKQLYNRVMEFIKGLNPQNTTGNQQTEIIVDKENEVETHFDKYGNISRVIDKKNGTDISYDTDWDSGKIHITTDNKTGEVNYFDEEGNKYQTDVKDGNKTISYQYKNDGTKYKSEERENGITTTYFQDGKVFSVDDGKTMTVYRYDNGVQYIKSTLDYNTGSTTYYRKDGSIDYIEDNESKERRYYDKDGNLVKSVNNKYVKEPPNGELFDAKNIANNLRIIYEGNLEDWENKNKYLKEMLECINNENLLDVLKENSKTDFTNNLFSYFIKEYDGSDKKQILEDKSKQLIEYAKNNDIYTQDFEKQFENLLAKNDFKNLAKAMDRLSERIIISKDTNKEYRASQRKKENVGPNGKIDSSFAQGYTGDCWLIASIITAKNDPKLAEKLDKMVEAKFEADGKTLKEVKVSIQGKEYLISAEELYGAVEYATGDLDVRALEIAINRYYLENDLGNIDDGGTTDEGLKILFGDGNYETKNIGKASDEYIENVRNGKYIASVVGSHVDIDSDTEVETGYYGIDDNGNKIPIYNRHGYNVIKADEQYVYIINPWDSGTTIRVTPDDFKKIFCGYASVSVIEK